MTWAWVVLGLCVEVALGLVLLHWCMWMQAKTELLRGRVATEKAMVEAQLAMAERMAGPHNLYATVDAPATDHPGYP